MDFNKNSTNPSIWKFSPFLPRFKTTYSLIEGSTPLVQLKNTPNLKGLNVKLEFRNPTGSFRDRASALIVSHAKMVGAEKIMGANTGSYGISLASYCAMANLKCANVVPQNIELSKIEQLKIFNSEIIEKGDSLDKAMEYAENMEREKNVYYPFPKSNILTIEGQKTIGIEVASVLGDQVESIIIPQGSGSLILSIHKGLEDALESGLITESPKIYSVSLKRDTSQSYLVESLEQSTSDLKLLDRVSKIVEESGGEQIEIGPGEMLDDAMELAKMEGHFIEPASSSVISAVKYLKKEKNLNIKKSVAILSGSGLNALNIFASKMRKVKKAVWGLAPRSTRKFEILNLIAENQANNGSEIWKALGKKKSRQSIYQHLAELEAKGLIVSQMKTKKAKKYSLTRKGFEALDTMRDLIDLL